MFPLPASSQKQRILVMFAYVSFMYSNIYATSESTLMGGTMGGTRHTSALMVDLPLDTAYYGSAQEQWILKPKDYEAENSAREPADI